MEHKNSTQTLIIRIQAVQHEWRCRRAEEGHTTLVEATRRAISFSMGSDHNTECLSALEARLMFKLDHIQKSIDELGIEEVSHE